MSKTYLITLRPLDTYYFGGERTFGNGDEANYFAFSRKFPQQTTLLGMLRYELFKANQNMGQESFDGTKANQSFGLIEKLSPVFLQEKTKGTTLNYLIGKQVNVEESSSNCKTAYAHQAVRLNAAEQLTYFAHDEQKGLLVEDYKEKHGLETCLIAENGKINKDKLDKVFIKCTRPGIQKSTDGATEDKAYFKQEQFTLKQGYTFAFFATVDDAFTLPAEQEMPLGGERKVFAMTAEDVTKSGENFNSVFSLTTFDECIDTKLPYIVLASDAYVPLEVYDYCQFVITEVTNFRNINTPSKNTIKNYSGISRKINSKDNSFLSKNTKMMLLSRGSVLILKDEAAFATATSDNLLGHPNFRQIGYNHYFTNVKTKKNDQV